MKVIRKFQFSACYYLKKPDIPKGKDPEHFEIYGHNFEVYVEVEGEVNPETGMVINLEHLKNAVKPVIEKLDHKCLNDLPFFNEEPPTLENVAKYIFREIKNLPKNVKLISVRIENERGHGAEYDGKEGFSTVELEFSASHRLPSERVKENVYGKCGEEKHGHNYRLKIAYQSESPEIVEKFKEILRNFDHTDLDRFGMLDFSTGEYILGYFARIFEALPDTKIRWLHLEETENNSFETGISPE